MNKIFTLESKNGDILAILTTTEDINYYDFLSICKEVGEEFDNDYFIVKDKLISNMNFKEVDFLGGYVVAKRKGVF